MRSRRFGLTPLCVWSVAVAVLGCHGDADSPTAPQSSQAESAPAAAAATPLSFRQVGAGHTHTCGVTTDYRAYCWGGSAPTPKLVPGGLRFLQLSAADGLTCGVTTNNRAYCWALNSVPTEVPGGRRFRQVSVGGEARSGSYACGVTPTDVAFCWGSNEYSRLGTGGGFFTTVPVRVAGGLRWRRVHAAFSHTCGVTTDDRAYCWGTNAFGDLGTGNFGGVQPKPAAVAGGLRFRVVRPGSGNDNGVTTQEIDLGLTCGVTVDDRAYCWGNGALGSATEVTNLPRAVAGGRRFNFVHPGWMHACALTLSDVAFCWGENHSGQLGRPGIGSQTPVQVAGGLRFLSLSVGTSGSHTCGVTRDHRAYCWGENGSRQLGDGTDIDRSTPVAVAGAM